MENIFDKKVSFFGSLEDKKPTAELSLKEVLLTDKWKDKILKLRSEKDPEKSKKLKNSLPFFVPSGITIGRKDSDLVEHNGVICIDIDKKDNTNVLYFENLKEVLSVIPYIAYLGHSASGSGYLAIIPIKDPRMHKECFKSLEIDFKRCGIKIDSACSNEGRIRFVSYDPKQYINENAKTYNRILKSGFSTMKQHKSTEINRKNLDTVEKWIEILQKYGTKKEFEYSEWFSMACALAWEFGEIGRDLFHSFSKAFPDYDYSDADNKFDEGLKAISDSERKHPTINRIEEIFRRHSITALADFEHINFN